ncbi:WAT1-related protein At5g40240-like isoform X2 [Juglans regia]|uniref:WAT1-related protein n=1 Tax=Juglans regia TaxID=51240 RepID=A0A6P9DXX8_JUGRE|nr:WAT1-related protein At5g40240-like isoform X2 [Juglans regia]
MESAALPFVGMMMVECAQVGLMIVGKVAMSRGMNNLIFIFYSNALASFILLPTSLFFHGSERPPITFSLLCGFFLLGLLGFGVQILGYAGILYSSPTLGTAMLNLIPAFTFILAVAFRMEKLDWRSSSSLAKSLGALVSITGAFIVTLYKGLPLLMTPSPSEASHQLLLQMSNWVVGGLLLAADSVLASVWLIMQALILKKYPAGLIVVFFYCFFVAIQSAVVSLVLERDLSSWSLQPNTSVGNVRFCIPSWHFCMVHAQDRACFCCYVQACGYFHFYCRGCYLTRRYFLSRKFDWSNSDCHWIFFCNVGKSQRTENEWGSCGKELRLQQTKSPSLAKQC